jgi:hypothetical protein
VKARDRPAGDGDEAEREQLAGEHRPGAVDEARQRRQLDGRPHHEEAGREQQHRPDLDERGEIVARREQQPHRQHARHEAVADDGERERLAIEIEPVAERLVLGDVAAADTASSTSATPPMLASSTRPGRSFTM